MKINLSFPLNKFKRHEIASDNNMIRDFFLYNPVFALNNPDSEN